MNEGILLTVCVESDKILLPLNSECAGSSLALENISREFAPCSSVESADKKLFLN